MKTLIIIRHAHRNKELGRELDNGLSPKGKKQARRIAKFFKKRFVADNKNTNFNLFSSPKKRCLETLLPIQKITGTPIETLDDLNEGGNIPNRIDDFLEKWNTSDRDFTILCSHGDWIPTFFEKFLGLPIELKKGAWAEIQIEELNKKLTWIIQEF